MNILFIGYGKTSQRVAKQLFADGHRIYTMSRSVKTDHFATHDIQDLQALDLSAYPLIDWVYVLLSPSESSIDGYQKTYVDTIAPIVKALQTHPVQRVVVVSSTRVYGDDTGQAIDDETPPNPKDVQGQLLLKMEQLWQQAYPQKTIIIRPSGIYGISVVRLQTLAQASTYPNIHWSNRIHIDDLAGFLAYLTQIPQSTLASSYIVSDSRPQPMHEILQWFQVQAKHSILNLDNTDVQTGKRLYATNLYESGFVLQHQNCFEVYQHLLNEAEKTTP
ncbi:NAD-dependent epimerase/dehydratase family protein [Acinetobacter sp. MD2]|uniref:NAD-dependent epimerase/dehydratase family protein n=1 Tax=Acinetobacter sp. MD2 TaxID=2600066 RepID=UPI002D1E9057|nr:NAD-dependent epimerase/dehydratase family protein [Acinetobacter sp. MD2]MEB3768129.1 NAD-dependent epimerase/dehydratase family protein [Acinetobacter sp. MD2]